MMTSYTLPILCLLMIVMTGSLGLLWFAASRLRMQEKPKSMQHAMLQYVYQAITVLTVIAALGIMVIGVAWGLWGFINSEATGQTSENPSQQLEYAPPAPDAVGNDTGAIPNTGTDNGGFAGVDIADTTEVQSVLAAMPEPTVSADDFIIAPTAQPQFSEPQATPTPFPTPTPYPTPTPKVFIPGQLIIPSLGLNQYVVSTPLYNNQWDLLNLGKRIGWLPTTGVHPNDDFAMVFAAHVTDYDGVRGPFYELRDLPAGTEFIYRWQGTDYTYQILQKEIVHPSAVEKLYIHDGTYAMLITCTNWNSGAGNYSDRVLAYAKLVRTTPTS